VLARLALELHYVEPARCRALSAQAIETARAAGDPSALAHTLNNAIWAIWVPETLQERKRLTDELVNLAHRLDDPWLSFWAANRRMDVGTETGDRMQAESQLAAMRALAASVRQPSIVWVSLFYEGGWALVQGDLPAAEQFATEAYKVGTASGQPDAWQLFGVLLSGLRNFQGRLGELVDSMMQHFGDADNNSAWRATAALVLFESGRADEARELVLAEDFQNVPSDTAWCLAMFLWADVCSRLPVLDRAGELYELLAPFASQITPSGAVVLGSFAGALGALATAMERYEQAESHFAAAAEIEERLGAPLFLARTRANWARALIARGRPEDLDRAHHMLGQAEETAERLGGGLITREAAECRTALAAISG
jgi:tetratricopeptide (TPR) repeat protein